MRRTPSDSRSVGDVPGAGVFRKFDRSTWTHGPDGTGAETRKSSTRGGGRDETREPRSGPKGEERTKSGNPSGSGRTPKRPSTGAGGQRKAAMSTGTEQSRSRGETTERRKQLADVVAAAWKTIAASVAMRWLARPDQLGTGIADAATERTAKSGTAIVLAAALAAALPLFAPATASGQASEIVKVRRGNGDASVILTFQRNLRTDPMPPRARFGVREPGFATEVPTSLSINGATLTLQMPTHLHTEPTVEAVWLPEPGATNNLAYTDGTAISGFTVEATTAPTVSSATTDAGGNSVTINFDEAMDTTKKPSISVFTIKADDTVLDLGTDFTYASRSTTIPLAANTWIEHGQSATISYSQPSTDPLQDQTQAFLVSFSDLAVTNSVIDDPAVTVFEDGLFLSYPVVLGTTQVPATTAYSVTVDGANRSVSKVAVSSGNLVTLTLSAAVNYGERVTVSYDPPATNPLLDGDGVGMPPIDAAAATNNTAQAHTRAVVNANQLTITYPAALTTTQVPAASTFSATVERATTVALTVSKVEVSDFTVTLTLSQAVNAAEVVTMTYNRPATNPLLYADGSRALAFSGAAVVNATKGYFQSAAVLDNQLGINFDTELIVGASAPAPAVGQFTVEVEGARRNVTNIARRGRTATLTLASAVSEGEVVTVGYAKPATNRLKSTAGEIAAFSDQEVLNITGRLPKISSVAITSTPALDADGNGTPETYGANETIDIDIEFNNPVEVIDDGSASNVYVWLDMAPNNTLDLAEDRRAVPFYATGRGDRIMRFRYTVEAGDRDADGVFVQPEPNNNTVVFLREGAVVQAPGLSEALADLTLAGLPFAGDPNHRVDGSRQAGDRTPPEVSGATADATTLKVTFDETLDASSAPAGDAFTVSGGRTGTGTAMISGDTATVTLDSAVLKDETVTVSYEQPASSPLQDAAGNAVASFSGESVTNLTERERPIADAGDDVEADPDERVTLDGSASTDPNGDRLTFAWTQVDGETVTLSGANSARLSFTAPAGSGVLTFRLTVTDPNGLTDTDEVSVFVGSPPQAGRPVADAGDDVEVEPGARVTFNGVGSSAPEDGSLSYTWQQLSGPSVRLDGAASAQVSFTAPREPSVLVFRLTVTSEAGITDTDDVRAIVGGLRPPVADAGNDLEAEPGQRVTLDGTGSTDPAGFGLTFAWEQTAGERVALSGTDSARLSFTAPETPGSLSFRLTVTDRDGLFDTDKVTVTVGDQGVSFGDAEIGTLNLTVGERIEPVRLPEASGGNGTLRYSLRSQPPGFAGLDYDARSRWLTGVARDAGTFTFTWRATDADGDTATVIFLVVVNSTPSAHAGNDIAVEPGGYVRLDGSRSADPEGDILTFAWTQIRGEQVTLPDPSYVQPSFSPCLTGLPTIL